METGIILILIASLIYLALGSVHALLTLFTRLFEPTNPEVFVLNKSTHPKITSQTTLWWGGVGFHLSHSLGIFIFGLFYFMLATEQPGLISSSLFFSSALVWVPLVYLFLSIRYWFILPTIGFGLSSLCFITGLLMLGK